MALYPLQLIGAQLGIATPAEAIRFEELPLNHKQAVDFFRNNLTKLLGPQQSLLILDGLTSFKSPSYFDFVAIDSQGALLQISIKTENESRGESLELHALNAVSRLASLRTIEELVQQITELESQLPISKDRTSDMQDDLNQFLKLHGIQESFNFKQKIILIAPFYQECLLKSMNWLSGNGVDICGYQLVPLKLGISFVFDFKKVSPVSTQRFENSQISNFDLSAPQAIKAPIAMTPIMEEASSNVLPLKKNLREPPILPSMQKLMDWGLLESGDRLKIRDFDDSDVVVVDHKFVSFKGEVLTYEQWGMRVTNFSSINIYDWAFHIRKGDTLFNLRNQRMKDQEILRAG